MAAGSPVSAAPGRACPLRYRYGAQALAAAPVRPAPTLYVIGGLYGNLPALDAVEALARAEPGPVTLCFNGDFNWFNVDNRGFAELNRRVLHHDAILGNVEAELQPEATDAGCGCAYPEWVDEGLVARSNLIHARLKATAARHPDVLSRLAALPMVARYRVGDCRVGVVHGDARSLAGWEFDVASLDDGRARPGIEDAFRAAAVDVFASSHTCLPAMRRFAPDGRPAWVINNGAAGMPNFSETQFGVITRIGVAPSPHAALYGVAHGNVHMDALPVRYLAATWERRFLENWPPNSPAWLSYYRRITEGPDYFLDRACPVRPLP